MCLINGFINPEYQSIPLRLDAFLKKSLQNVPNFVTFEKNGRIYIDLLLTQSNTQPNSLNVAA